jgi:hypothetical protein
VTKKAILWMVDVFFLVAVAGSPAQSPAARKESRLIPMEDFSRNPEKTDFKLSPDGRHIAYFKPWQGRLNVCVQKVDQGKAIRITEARQRDIAAYGWANNHRIGYV